MKKRLLAPIRAAFAGASLSFASFAPAEVSMEEKNAVRRLAALGAEIVSDGSGHATHFSCRGVERFTHEDFAALGSLRHLKKLSLSGAASVTDESIVALKDLTALEWVTLDGARLSDAGFTTLAGWTSLQKLTLYHLINRGKFTGAGVAHLKSLPRLEKFACGGSSFEDAGMLACAELPHLTDLMIWHTPVTDAGLVGLPRLKKLKNLRLAAQWLPRYTDAALQTVSRIRTLETLSFGETRVTYADGLKWLGDLPALKELELLQIDTPAGDIEKLKALLPGVKIDHTPVAEKYRELFDRNFRR